MSKYETNETKPSEMFIRALSGGGGSSSINCNCGRTHYAPSNLYHSEDESDYNDMLNDALAEQKNDPEGVVINLEDDFVYAKDIDNKTFVVDCPCNGLRRYEDWIWNNRNPIRDYIKLRVDQELRWAEEEKSINKLKGF